MLAKAEGVEFTDEVMDGISGGSDWNCASVRSENQECLGQVQE